MSALARLCHHNNYNGEADAETKHMMSWMYSRPENMATKAPGRLEHASNDQSTRRTQPLYTYGIEVAR